MLPNPTKPPNASQANEVLPSILLSMHLTFMRFYLTLLLSSVQQNQLFFGRRIPSDSLESVPAHTRIVDEPSKNFLMCSHGKPNYNITTAAERHWWHHPASRRPESRDKTKDVLNSTLRCSITNTAVSSAM